MTTAPVTSLVAHLLPGEEPLRFVAPDGTPAHPGAGGPADGLDVPADEVLLDLHRRMVVGRRLDAQCTALTRQGRLAVYPSARGQEFWIVLIFTYFIALGHFAHVVAGSGEAWLLAVAGETSFAHALFGIILPTLVGNIVGGTGLFALLAHAQVRAEI